MSLILRDLGRSTCHGPFNGGTGLNLDEARTNVDGFCADAAGTIIGRNVNSTKTYKTLLGDSDMQITIKRTKVCAQEKTYTVSLDTCQQSLYRILEECDINSGGELGHFGGNVINHCGVYDISTEPKEIVRCGGNPYQEPMDLYTSATEQAIYDYCNKTMSLAPAFNSNDRFFQSVPDGQSYHNYLWGTLLVRIRTQFNDQGQEDCAAPKKFGTKGDECRRKLTRIREQCGTRGGGLSKNGKNGCVLWTMWGQRLR